MWFQDQRNAENSGLRAVVEILDPMAILPELQRRPALMPLLADVEFQHDAIAIMPVLPWELQYSIAPPDDPMQREPKVLLKLSKRLSLISRARIEDDIPEVRHMEAIGAIYRDDVTVKLPEAQGLAFDGLVQRLLPFCEMPPVDYTVRVRD